MKNISNFFLSLTIGLSLLFAFSVHSQVLQVSSEITPEDMVEILIGTGVDYSNVSFTGADSSRGSFSGGPGNIGLTNGIILTSGHVSIAPGPNQAQGAGVSNLMPGDIDLSALSMGTTFDACVLEFDFVPYYQYLFFYFVFASEEYPEYVGMPFNDVFGFFINGPGLNGPYTNSSENIALIPDTEIPVTINNVNQNNYPEYFVMNDSNFIQYDGFTTVLTAEAVVVPMETYHIKLAISDATDYIYDSGVLLQASSFCSSPVSGTKQPAQPTLEEKYNIYPIPAGNVLNIESKGEQSFDIQLAGQDGRICSSGSYSSQASLDLSSLPAGIYFLRISDESGVMSKKIFKN